MQNETMPKPKSVGPISVLGLCSPLLLLAEVEAEGKAKKARLAAQQRGRVATRKKGRLGAALRHLWRSCAPQAGSRGGEPRHGTGTEAGFEVCRPRLRPHNSRKADSGALARAGKREGQPRGPVPQLPPKEEARRGQAVQSNQYRGLAARVESYRFPDGARGKGDGLLWPSLAWTRQFIPFFEGLNARNAIILDTMMTLRKKRVKSADAESDGN